MHHPGQRLLGRDGQHDPTPVAPSHPLDAEAEEHEPVVDVRNVCLLLREGHPQRAGQQLSDLGPQRFGVGPAAVHEHDEVVGEAHQPIVRQPFAAALLTPPRRAHVALFDPREVPVEDGQVDVGQQRGGDPTLRRAGQARREPAMLLDKDRKSVV